MTETTAAYEHLVGKAVRVRRYTQPGLADNHPDRVLTAEHVGTVVRLLPHDVIELRVTDSPDGPGLVQVGLGYVYLGREPDDCQGRGLYLVTEVTPWAEVAEPEAAADVEVGTMRSLNAAGRDLVRAAMAADTAGTVTHVTLEGRRIAAVVPAAWLTDRPGSTLAEAGPRYIAHFTPEAWQRDQAVEVDPQGPQEWDCTGWALAHQDYLDRVARASGNGVLLDTDDVFQDDPAAPAWVREWRGPFIITIRREG